MRKDGPIHLTPAGIQAMLDEMEAVKDEIPSTREELTSTREMGDLSENAGYQIAKGRLRYLQNRLLGLTERMKRVVEIKPSNSGKVQLGSHVIVTVDGTEREYHIVGPSESNPVEGRISMLSPLGKVLMNRKIDDKAELQREENTLQIIIKEIK